MQDLILSFNVEGSTGNIYNIEFIKKIEGISASCNCDAGKKKQFCKHIMSLVNKDSGNDELILMIAGSTFEQAISDVAKFESELESAKKQLSNAKKHLSKITYH
jgi:hypothetical protein